MSLTRFGEKLELRSEVEVSASPTQIWRALTDFERYPQWNPYIVRAKGVLAKGERIDLVVSPPGSREMRVRRQVEVLRELEELRWSGGYGFGLLLRSEQYFLLSPRDNGQMTRLIVGENLFGPGVTGNNPTVMNIARGLSLMNQAIKRRLESAAETLAHGND
jgi:hypothetical protein